MESIARAAGFHRAALALPERLLPIAARLRDVLQEGGGDREHLRGMEWSWVLRPESWAGSHSILICCLSCARNDPEIPSPAGDPQGLIAPFARAHYYRLAIRLLRSVALRIEQEWGILHGSLRLFSNSRIPEKPLLAATGIGAYGKNGCMIVPGLGSELVIAGAVIPALFAPEEPPPLPIDHDPCGSCRRCQDACPTAALDHPARLDVDRCLQAFAGSSNPFPGEAREAWGTRLYGCQTCQECCPHNRDLGTPAPAAEGEMGPGISLRRFLGMDEEERRALLRGSALGVGWIPASALLRNALIAAGNSGERSLRGAVETHARSENQDVRRAAEWALERLGR